MDTIFGQVNVKGQIVIPAALRNELKIRPGTKIAIQRDGGAIVLQPVTDEFLRSLRGCLKRRGYGSLTEIWEGVHKKEAEGERHKYGRQR